MSCPSSQYHGNIHPCSSPPSSFKGHVSTARLLSVFSPLRIHRSIVLPLSTAGPSRVANSVGIRSRRPFSPVSFLVTIEETIRPFEMSLLLRQYYRNTGSPCAAPFLPVVQGPRTASLLRTRSCSPVPRPEWGQLSRPRRRVVISLVFPVRCRPRLDVCRAALPGLRSGSGPLAKTRRVGYSLLCFPFLHFFRDGTCRA